MTNAILLRSGVNRKVHAPFWSRVERGDPLGLGNIRAHKDIVELLIEKGAEVKAAARTATCIY